MAFHSVSFNINEVLSINPSANVFIFGDFNIHHKYWLTYFGGTAKTGELCYNFSISHNLTQMVNFPTQIPDFNSHSTTLLNLSIYSDAIIYSAMVFPKLESSDHVVASVSNDFHQIHNGMPHFTEYLTTILMLIGTVFMII